MGLDQPLIPETFLFSGIPDLLLPLLRVASDFWGKRLFPFAQRLNLLVQLLLLLLSLLPLLVDCFDGVPLQFLQFLLPSMPLAQAGRADRLLPGGWQTPPFPLDLLVPILLLVLFGFQLTPESGGCFLLFMNCAFLTLDVPFQGLDRFLPHLDVPLEDDFLGLQLLLFLAEQLSISVGRKFLLKFVTQLKGLTPLRLKDEKPLPLLPQLLGFALEFGKAFDLIADLEQVLSGRVGDGGPVCRWGETEGRLAFRAEPLPGLGTFLLQIPDVLGKLSDAEFGLLILFPEMFQVVLRLFAEALELLVLLLGFLGVDLGGVEVALGGGKGLLPAEFLSCVMLRGQRLAAQTAGGRSPQVAQLL
jgi:hypothetical protein